MTEQSGQEIEREVMTIYLITKTNNCNKGTWIKRKSSQKQEQEEDDAKSDQNMKKT